MVAAAFFLLCLSTILLLSGNVMQCVMFAVAGGWNWMSDTTWGAGITVGRIDAICPMMVLFYGSEATNQGEKCLCRSVWFYSLSGERQIEYQWCASKGL